MKQSGTCLFIAISIFCACTRREQERPRDEPARRTADQGPVSVAPTPLSTSMPIPPPGTSEHATTDAHTDGGPAEPKREAEAEFKAAKGYKLKGEAEFHELSNMVKAVVNVSDAPPGKRGIHVHEKPDCSDIAGKSMGEHFNPTANAHGLPPAASRHLGDLGNIEIGKDGKGKLEVLLPKANLKENDALSLLNRALVIHEDEDTGGQPSGVAGKPIACAVINKD